MELPTALGTHQSGQLGFSRAQMPKSLMFLRNSWIHGAGLGYVSACLGRKHSCMSSKFNSQNLETT